MNTQWYPDEGMGGGLIVDLGTRQIGVCLQFFEATDGTPWLLLEWGDVEVWVRGGSA